MDSSASSSRKRRKHITVEYSDKKQNTATPVNQQESGQNMQRVTRFSRLKKSVENLGKNSTITDEFNKTNLKQESDSAWFPANWEKVLDNIRQMRVNKDAPVDSMGAEKCTDPNSPPEVQRFQVLVSLMLSSQTKDQVTFAAMGKLRTHGLTVENMVNTSEEEIARLIHPVGFWKVLKTRKASYIKKTAEVLASKYNGDVPSTIKELCTLPGVGPKMATICANIAWEEAAGIGVDTHVHRIANRLGWVEKTTKSPEETQKLLERWLPKDLWKEVNVLFVGFGQQMCTPLKPRCGDCLNKELCPYGKVNLKP